MLCSRAAAEINGTFKAFSRLTRYAEHKVKRNIFNSRFLCSAYCSFGFRTACAPAERLSLAVVGTLQTHGNAVNPTLGNSPKVKIGVFRSRVRRVTFKRNLAVGCSGYMEHNFRNSCRAEQRRSAAAEIDGIIYSAVFVKPAAKSGSVIIEQISVRNYGVKIAVRAFTFTERNV